MMPALMSYSQPKYQSRNYDADTVEAVRGMDNVLARITVSGIKFTSLSSKFCVCVCVYMLSLQILTLNP